MQFQGGVFAGITFRCPPQKKNKCCQRRVCIISYELFNNLCIDRHVLGLAIRSRRDARVEPLDFSMPQFQKSCVQAVCFMGTWVFRQGQQKSHSILLCEKSATEFSCPRQHVSSSSSSSFICLLNIKILKIQYVGCKARRPQETTRLITEAMHLDITILNEIKAAKQCGRN